MLGGVEIPYPKGLDGHSDADVLLHAVSDAMLGALGLGDIGIHFPDTDPKYKDARGLDLLEAVNGLIRKKGFMVNNADCVIVAEKPKVSPFFDKMKSAISEILHIEVSRIGIKATTNENIGPIGKGEAIAGWAVVLLNKL